MRTMMIVTMAMAFGFQAIAWAQSVTLSVSPVSFGVTDGSAPVYANGNVAVEASLGTPYNITLDAGLNVSAGQRNLGMLSFLIAYELYQNASLTLIWGDSDFANTYSSGSSLSGTGSGVIQNYAVYGKLFAFSAEETGVFTDAVTVTVHF